MGLAWAEGRIREGGKAALQMVISPAPLLDGISADSGGKSRLLLEWDERELERGRAKEREREQGFMLNFIKFLAEGRGLQDHKGLIWSHNPFPFDYQLLIEALNWSLLNMAACKVGRARAGLSDLTESGTRLEWR